MGFQWQKARLSQAAARCFLLLDSAPSPWAGGLAGAPRAGGPAQIWLCLWEEHPSAPGPHSSLPRPSAGHCGLCQGWGVTQQGRRGTFVLRAFCETGRCCQQFNKLCLSSNAPLNLDLCLIRQSSHVLSGHMYYLKNIYKGLMYSGAPLTQISIISSAKSQNSPAYSKKPFSSVCLSLNLAVEKMLDLQYLFIYRTLLFIQ